MRRLLVVCAVAGAGLAAYAVAQNGSAGAAALRWYEAKSGTADPSPQSAKGAAWFGMTPLVVEAQAGTTAAAGLPANARVVANGVAARDRKSACRERV